MNTFIPIFESMKPRQWYRNLLIFLPLVYTQNLFNVIFIVKTLLAFLIFCLATGALSVLDDLLDKESDKINPLRKNRAIAAERISINRLEFTLAATVVGVLFSSFFLNTVFGILVMFYFAIMISYSVTLKKIFIVDAAALSFAAAITALCGAVVINENISPWILISAFTAGLILALAKLKAELISLGSLAPDLRVVFKSYTREFLNSVILLLCFTVLNIYAVASVIGDTAIRIGSSKLIYSLPFVIFGVLKFIFIVQKDSFKTVEDDVIGDLQFVINVIVWFLATVFLIYV